MNENNQNTVDPNQTSLIDDNPTIIHIDHKTESKPAPKNDNEENTGSNKMKIVAALAIVAMASYVAYWVQEPVQLKTDVMASDQVAQATPTEKDVTITLYGFEPANLTIDKGTVVKWTNTSSEDQSIIGASKDGDGFTSPVLSNGQTFSFTFDKDASFEYYSTYNPALKATITVGTGGTGTTPTPVTTTTPETSTQTTPASTTTTATPEVTTSPISTSPAITSAPASSPTAADLAAAAAAANATAMANENANTVVLTNAAQTANLHGTAYNGKLAKTGPEDGLYVLAALAILYFNRKKLLAAFCK